MVGNKARKVNLPNGSAFDGSTPQVLEPQQHGKHSLKLSIEMDLVASKTLQLFRIERVAESLLADQRPVGQFLLPVVKPRSTSLSWKRRRPSTSAVAGSLPSLVRIGGERVRPPSLCVLAKRRQGGFVGIVSLGT